MNARNAYTRMHCPEGHRHAVKIFLINRWVNRESRGQTYRVWDGTVSVIRFMCSMNATMDPHEWSLSGALRKALQVEHEHDREVRFLDAGDIRGISTEQQEAIQRELDLSLLLNKCSECGRTGCKVVFYNKSAMCHACARMKQRNEEQENKGPGHGTSFSGRSSGRKRRRPYDQVSREESVNGFGEEVERVLTALCESGNFLNDHKTRVIELVREGKVKGMEQALACLEAGILIKTHSNLTLEKELEKAHGIIQRHAMNTVFSSVEQLQPAVHEGALKNLYTRLGKVPKRSKKDPWATLFSDYLKQLKF